MRIREFRVHEQFEVVMECEFFVSESDVSALSLLDDGSAIHWLDDGINSVLHVLNKH